MAGPLPFFAAFGPVGRRHNVSVWADVVDHGHDDQPQPIGHFVQQLVAEAPLVEGLSSFEWLRYMSPRGVAGPQLYDAYVRYFDQRKSGDGASTQATFAVRSAADLRLSGGASVAAAPLLSIRSGVSVAR